MRLDIRDLSPEGARFDGPLELPDLALYGDERIVVRAASTAGTAVPGSLGTALRARLKTRLELGCVRCLERFEIELDVSFELILVIGSREPDPETGSDDAAPDDAPDPATFFAVPGGIVDLAAVAREQIYLNVPLKPVCRPDCRGLCPTCGQNRNRLECACRDEAGDPRLAPLLEFRKRLRGS
jgi:uncharacterized protein